MTRGYHVQINKRYIMDTQFTRITYDALKGHFLRYVFFLIKLPSRCFLGSTANIPAMVSVTEAAVLDVFDASAVMILLMQ